MNLSVIGAFLAALAADPQQHRMNIAMLIIDDMRFDELPFLPFVESMSSQAFVFDAAYVSNPLCCPTRSSILSGGYFSKNHGVLTNKAPNGGAFAFAPIDGDTIATRLQAAGYSTGLFGKYLNAYPTWAAFNSSAPIPPGWSSFAGCDNESNWNTTTLWVGSSAPAARGAGSEETATQYIPYELRDRAMTFLDSSPRPWFLYFAALAPHLPATPDPIDAGEYLEFASGGSSVYRWRAWGEDVSDKPAWVRAETASWWAGDPDYYSEQAPFRPGHVTPDDLVADRRRSMLAVDRTIEELWSRFDDNTAVILISDNGFFYGEHLLSGKGAPYEEAIRVPMLVWLPRRAGRIVHGFAYADVDSAATIMSLAGLPQFAGADGRSLMRMMTDFAPGRATIYAQNWNEPDDSTPGWVMVRDVTRKAVALDTGEIEAYDLSADPYEMDNLGDVFPDLFSSIAATRGLSMRTDSVPDASKNVPYAATLDSWGGTAPYTYSIASGTLPPGLALSSTGEIAGAPAHVGTYAFRVRVQDSSSSPKRGGPQRFACDLTITVR